MSNNPNNNRPSKKRAFNQISNDLKQDEDLLFGGGAERDGDENNDFEGGDDQAMEDDDNIYEDDKNEVVDSEEDADGEDLMENMEQDYEAKDELDQYEADGIDDEEQDEIDYNERREADKKMNQEARDRARYRNRQPGAFMMDDEGEYSEEDELQRQMRLERMRQQREERDGGFEQGGDLRMQDVLDLEDVKGKLSTWVQRPEVSRWIRNTFSQFLREFKDDNDHNVHEQRINDMCSNNKQSLEITFTQLSQKYPTLAIWLAEDPTLILPILNVVAYDITLELFPEYNKIHKEIYVRIGNLPVEDRLRDLRQINLNALIKIRGVVTKRTNVMPELSKIFFRCVCGDIKGPIFHTNTHEAKQYLGQCVLCQANGPYMLDETHTLYRNFQKMTLQETPGTVPPGRVPRQKEVFVQHDLVDTARPGDEVEVTGIYVNRFEYFANVKHGFPVFQTIIEANNIKRYGDADIVDLTDEDKQLIIQASKSPNIAKRIFASIAPSIYGHQFVKKALSLAMFGGMAKDIGGKHRIRGDINCLLLGDPGTAKSQFLKYVEQVFHRCVYTTGKGASAVGLTAGVHKDPVTGEWTLEGGALVLADKGICLIDEFDKMNDSDRTSIHEAMEQQSISISKAGIVTSLQARCSVIAAANPIKGTYNTALNFVDNVDLTDPILSRFDILTVIKDDVNEDADDALATFVINSHIKSHPEIQRDMNPGFHEDEEIDKHMRDKKDACEAWLNDTLLDETKVRQIQAQQDFEGVEPLSQDLLKKYIMYARRYCQPKLNEIDQEKVTQFYADIRRESQIVGGIPIAVRHIESVLRMSEAHAKIHCRDYVRSDDIDVAINMLLESFLQSQKLSVARQLGKKFEQYKTRKTDPNQLLYHLVKKMATDRAIYEKYVRGIEELEKIEVKIPKDQFEHEARDFAHSNIENFYKSGVFCKDFRIEAGYIQTTTKI